MSTPVAFIGKPGPNASIDQRLSWIETILERLSAASQDGTDTIADSFEITNPPAVPVRTLDPSTATARDVANVVSTFLSDLRQRGVSGGTS